MKKTLILTVLLFASIWPSYAQAQGSGIPTFDVAVYTQQLEEIARLQNLIEETRREIEHISGTRNVNSLISLGAQTNIIDYAPETWDDYLNIIESGFSSSSIYSLGNSYQENAQKFGLPTNEEYRPNDINGRNALAYGQLRDTTLTGLSLSEASYNANAQRFENYRSLINAIDSAADIKASQDLTNRIAAENGLTQAELIRLLSTSVQLEASKTSQDLANEAANAEMARTTPGYTPPPIE